MMVVVYLSVVSYFFSMMPSSKKSNSKAVAFSIESWSNGTFLIPDWIKRKAKFAARLYRAMTDPAFEEVNTRSDSISRDD
jgi:hypothetical protein